MSDAMLVSSNGDVAASPVPPPAESPPPVFTNQTFARMKPTPLQMSRILGGNKTAAPAPFEVNPLDMHPVPLQAAGGGVHAKKASVSAPPSPKFQLAPIESPPPDLSPSLDLSPSTTPFANDGWSLEKIMSDLPAVDSSAPMQIQLTALDGSVQLAMKHSAAEESLAPPKKRKAKGPKRVLPVQRVSVLNDSRHLFILSLPNVAFVLVNTLSSFFQSLFLGQRLGSDYLGAISLANMILNISGYNLAQGAASSLESLCAQAYGAGKYELVGRWTQRAMVLLTLMAVPVLIIWMQTTKILKGIGMDPVQSELAQTYAFLAIIGIWPNFMFECVRRYLAACGLLWPIVVATSVSCAVQIGLTYIEVFILEGGIEGAAIATVVSQWSCMLSAVACMVGKHFYLKWKRGREARQQSLPMHEVAERTISVTGRAMESPRMAELPSDSPQVPRLSPPPPLRSPSPDFSRPSTPSLSPAVSRSPSPAPGDPLLPPQQFYGDNFLRPYASNSPPVSEPSTPGVSSMPSDATPNQDVSSTQVDSSLAPEKVSTWPNPFDRAVLRDWGPLVRLALPGALSVVMENGAFQATSVIAATFSKTDLAVHSIFAQTTSILYIIPSGYSTAAAIAVGQMVGAGLGPRAWDVVRMSYAIGLTYPLVMGGLFIASLRSVWPTLFSSEADVLARAASCMPILLLYFFGDHTKCVTMTLMRAMGRNAHTAYTNMASCWLFGFPLILMLCFTPGDFGLMGLWGGIASTWVCSAAIFTVLLLRTDWNTIGKPKDAAAAASNTNATPASAAASAVELGEVLLMEKAKQSPPVPGESAPSSSRTSRESSLSLAAPSLYSGSGMSPTVIDDSSRRSSAIW